MFPAMSLLKELMRLWPGFRRMMRRFVLLTRQPDVLNLNGVKLEMGAWATASIRRLIYQGWYEENERAVLQLTLQPDDIVLELGCGAGYITTLAARTAHHVRAFEANPAMAHVARSTLARNGVGARIDNAVVERTPKEAMVRFYIEPNFVASSLKPSASGRPVAVQTCDLASACDGCTYLIVDIEGAEVDLLRGELPGIRAICVETHPKVTGLPAISDMLVSLFEQGFVLGIDRVGGTCCTSSAKELPTSRAGQLDHGAAQRSSATLAGPISAGPGRSVACARGQLIGGS